MKVVHDLLCAPTDFEVAIVGIGIYGRVKLPCHLLMIRKGNAQVTRTAAVFEAQPVKNISQINFAVQMKILSIRS